jgi:hypothetical protein
MQFQECKQPNSAHKANTLLRSTSLCGMCKTADLLNRVPGLVNSSRMQIEANKGSLRKADEVVKATAASVAKTREIINRTDELLRWIATPQQTTRTSDISLCETKSLHE